MSGFDIEEHQVDLHYYLKNSTCRKGILAEYMDFVGLEWEELTHVLWQQGAVIK
jgi:DNA polymerase elongation subunit (family B)